MKCVEGFMAASLKTQLRIPADSRFLAMIQGHVRGVATIAGLAPKDILALELATEEAFLNIRDHAYPGGIPGDVIVSGEIGDGELRLDFHDQGLPFDPSLLSRADDPSGTRGSGGLGLKLIHHAADEVHWVNHGRQGKGLCLVKRLPLAAEPIPTGAPTEVPPAPAHTYAIRPMRPDEALRVTRIFWLAYGYSYKNDAFYRPEGLVRLVGTGQLVSYVAVTETGEVAAHAGLLRSEPVPMAEIAVLVVSPAHRGRGLMGALTTALIEKAREIGLFGLSFNPVTSHAYSQRQAMEFGARPCGLELAACPPQQFKAMGLDDVAPQRESYLHCFLYLNTPPAAVVHVPVRHRDIAGRIYAQFDRSLTLAPPGEGPAPGNYKVSFDRGPLKGSIRVVRADARQWPELLRAAVDLTDIAGAEVISLDLPLAQPATPLLCERAEAAGFFFAGIWPHGAPDGDMLRLMRLASPLDLERVRIHSEFGRELLRYVGAEMERAATAVISPCHVP
ncbi:GNAT family N-acetyltransferase [Desulfolutivibrio sulfoxidireducens]|uniref:GNAT family N-acetyltransferase n=1 Tax=Desulfolutivibrio sulfoxidireducens TaxID=2773299 RepID=UPI00159DF483|nr:GNAT family N-acetyltransferase [Desulfolutivibrio sulfoxidireducens]QLA15373.1 GNAT family N-acetyltransferase [Desulfolutivibrio sulfoxidireducens]